jgi:hypothetical protein
MLNSTSPSCLPTSVTQLIVILSAATLLGPLPALAGATGELEQTAVPQLVCPSSVAYTLNTYLYGSATEDPAVCTSDQDTDCLEPTSYIATRSDGRKVKVSGVYHWRAAGDTWGDHGFTPRKRLLVHFLTTYLKKLRNAYSACPNYFTQAYNQVDFIVSDGIEHNGALVWENRLGIAQAMEQADMASIFASIAEQHEKHGYWKEARGTMGYALRAARAFFKPVGTHTGGVRSVNQDACAAKTARLRPCFWFHSRGRGIDTEATGEPLVNTVLNQHLIAVRDLIELSMTTRELAHLIPANLPPPHYDFRTWLTWGDLLEDRAIGGLYQLAFSNGHKAVAPTRPPNLAQFMFRRSGDGQWYYTARYNFDLLTGQQLDIKHSKVCHYQGLALNVLATIWSVLDESGHLLTAADGWRLSEAMNRLLQGGGEPVGLWGSSHALYQFYRTEDPDYRTDIWGCPADVNRLTQQSYDIFAPYFGPWPGGYR